MGTEVVKAVNDADDLELVAMVDDGDWLFNVADAGAQVVVDFTRPDVVMDNIRFCIDQNIHCVVGTTGFDEASARHGRRVARAQAGASAWSSRPTSVSARCCSCGSRRRRRGSSPPWRSSSCTTPTRSTPRRGPPSGPPGSSPRPAGPPGMPAAPDATTDSLPGARGADVEGVPVHAVRLRGLVAHQEVLMGAGGGDPDPAPRLLRPGLVHARRAPGRPRDRRPAGPDRGDRGLPGALYVRRGPPARGVQRPPEVVYCSPCAARPGRVRRTRPPGGGRWKPA